MVEPIAEAETATEALKESKAISVKLAPDEEERMIAAVNELVSPYGLGAEFLGQVMTVGVVGDFRAYTRVINLTGLPIHHKVLACLANDICNTFPITRITFEPLFELSQ